MRSQCQDREAGVHTVGCPAPHTGQTLPALVPVSCHCSPWPLSGRGCIVHCVFVVCLWASSPPPSSSYDYNPRSEDYPAPWAFFGDSIGASSALVRLTRESAAQTEAPQHFSGPPRPSLPLQLWFNYTYHIRAQAGSTSRTLMERQGEKRWNTSESCSCWGQELPLVF